MNTKRFLLLLLVGALVSGTTVHAKFYAPDFERSFQNQLKRHDLTVVHFNPFPEDEEDEPELDQMKEAFVDLSKSDRYKDADVAFIGVNLHKLPDLADDFDIEVPDWAAIEEAEAAAEEAGAEQEEAEESGAPPADQDAEDQDGQEDDEDDIEITKEQESTIILFKEGKPFKEKGKIVKRTGFMTERQIKDFIEVHFGSIIDNLLSSKETEEREREKVREARPATKRTVYRYPAGQKPGTRRYRVGYTPQRTYVRRVYRRPSYGYYGRPWGGYGWGGYGGYGWGRPGFGIGFGFGRRGFRRGSFGFGW